MPTRNRVLGMSLLQKNLRGCLSNLSLEPYLSRRLKFAKTFVSTYESNGTLFYLTIRIHSSLRPFSVTAGSTAIAAIPVCLTLGVYAFKLCVLEFIWGFYSQYSESALQMFPFCTQTPNI